MTTELLTQILTTQEKILAELQRGNQKQERLGFVDPPVIRRIYCNLQYDGLYHWNGGTKQAEVLPTMAIACYVEGLKVEEGTYKNKPSNKLLVLIRADKRYVLVMGLETLTTKSLLLGLLRVDLKQAVTLAFRAGTSENALFCDVYQNGQAGFEEGRTLVDLTSVQINQMINQVDDRLQGLSGADAFGQIESDGESSTSAPLAPTPPVADPLTGQQTLPVGKQAVSVDQIRATLRQCKTLEEILALEQVWMANRTGLEAMDLAVDQDFRKAKQILEKNAESPVDLSDLISQIGVEIQRIGWNKKQGSNYLQTKYQKKTRAELTQQELIEFLAFLKAQPTLLAKSAEATPVTL